MPFLDTTDVTERLYSLLPQGWFPDLVDSPNLNAVLSLLAGAYSNDTDGLWQFLEYVAQQSRIFTASGFWLDIAASDYFGAMLQRHTNESDDSFRRRIILNLLAPRGTRPALVANVTNLTGFVPKIIELRNTGDCGAYASLNAPVWGGAVYNQLGAYGTMVMPYQLLISCTRPPGEGIPNVNGYSMSGAGYATYPYPFGYVGGFRPPVNTWGNGEYVELTDIIGQVTDADIYQTIAVTMPAGTIAWTAISSQLVESPPTGGGAMLNSNFYLDLSVLGEAATINQPGGLLGSGMMTIRASGNIAFQADLLGIARLSMLASGRIVLLPPTTLSGSWMFPSIQAIGSISSMPTRLTIPIQLVGPVIYTTTVQPLMPTDLPFILGTIPNAQTLLGVNFILGTSAPGEKGGVGLTSAISVCQIGTIISSIPPNISGVATGGAASEVEVSGVGLSTTFNINGVNTVGNAGTVGNEPQLLLPTDLPFILGTTSGTAPTVQVAISGASTTCHAGSVNIPIGTVIGAASPSTAGMMQVQTSEAQQWNASRKTSTIAISNGGLTATQTGTSDDPVYAIKSATTGKYYWELNVSLGNASEITAGIGNTIAGNTAGDFVGSDANSVGWQASTGSVLNNDTALSTWPAWTSTGNPSVPGTPVIGSITGTTMSLSWAPSTDTVTVCFALDLTDGLLWGRVGSGPWNGLSTGSGGGLLTLGVGALGAAASSAANPSQAPAAPSNLSVSDTANSVTLSWSASVGETTIPAAVLASAVSPAVTLFEPGDVCTAVFLSTSWQLTPPTGYTQW